MDGEKVGRIAPSSKPDSWYKRDPARARRGTRGLSPLEKSIYHELIDLTYEYGRPPVDDPKRLAHLCEVHRSVFERARDALLKKGRILRVDGCLVDELAVATLNERAEAREQAVENGSAGGRKSSRHRASKPSSPRDDAESAQSSDDLHRPVSNENKDSFQGGLNQERERIRDKNLESSSLGGVDESEPDADVETPAELLRADGDLNRDRGEPPDRISGATPLREPDPPDRSRRPPAPSIAARPPDLSNAQLNRACCNAAAVGSLANGKTMFRSVGKLQAALRDGCALDEMLRLIADRTARRHGKAVINGWAFFDGAFREAREARQAATAEPGSPLAMLAGKMAAARDRKRRQEARAA